MSLNSIFVTEHIAMALADARRCRLERSTIDVFRIVPKPEHVHGEPRQKLYEIRGRLDRRDDGVIVLDCPVIPLLQACRRSRGLRVPSSRRPADLAEDARLDEDKFAEALASDGISPYRPYARPTLRSGALKWARRNADGGRGFAGDLQRVSEALMLCGLIEPTGIDDGYRIRWTKVAFRQKTSLTVAEEECLAQLAMVA